MLRLTDSEYRTVFIFYSIDALLLIDALGTIRVAKKSAGTVTYQWTTTLNAFGDQSPTGTADYVNGFRGQLYDAESGQYYNVHRYYDAATGWYVQSDPLGLTAGPTTYAYGRNNPLSYIDPTGRDAILLKNPSSVDLLGLGLAYGGHAAAAVGDDKNGWSFYSEGGYDDDGNQIITSLNFPNLNALEDALQNQFAEQEGEHTQPLQDILMNSWARKHLADPYHALTNNCGDFAANVLRAGFLNPSANRFGPTVPNDMSIGSGPNDSNRFDPLADRVTSSHPGFFPSPGNSSQSNTSEIISGNPHTY